MGLKAGTSPRKRLCRGAFDEEPEEPSFVLLELVDLDADGVVTLEVDMFVLGGYADTEIKQ